MKILTIKKNYIYWAIRMGKFIYCVHPDQGTRSPRGCAGVARRTAGLRGWHRRKQHAPRSATSIHGAGSFAFEGSRFPSGLRHPEDRRCFSPQRDGAGGLSGGSDGATGVVDFFNRVPSARLFEPV